ncbi:MAG: hypothetical protein ACREDP_05680 [Bradyrhizobium sp.]
MIMGSRLIGSLASPRTIAVLLLSTICATLGLIVRAELSQFLQTALPNFSAVSTGTANTVAAETLQPPVSWDSLPDMIARPIFSPTRRAAPPPAVEAPAPSPDPVVDGAGVVAEVPPPDVTLVGVVLADFHRVALLRGRNDNQTLRVTVGDLVGPWHVVAIDERHAILGLNGRYIDLPLYRDLLVKQPTTLLEGSSLSSP